MALKNFAPYTLFVILLALSCSVYPNGTGTKGGGGGLLLPDGRLIFLDGATDEEIRSAQEWAGRTETPRFRRQCKAKDFKLLREVEKAETPLSAAVGEANDKVLERLKTVEGVFPNFARRLGEEYTKLKDKALFVQFDLNYPAEKFIINMKYYRHTLFNTYLAGVKLYSPEEITALNLGDVRETPRLRPVFDAWADPLGRYSFLHVVGMYHYDHGDHPESIYRLDYDGANPWPELRYSPRLIDMQEDWRKLKTIGFFNGTVLFINEDDFLLLSQSYSRDQQGRHGGLEFFLHESLRQVLFRGAFHFIADEDNSDKVLELLEEIVPVLAYGSKADIQKLATRVPRVWVAPQSAPSALEEFEKELKRLEKNKCEEIKAELEQAVYNIEQALHVDAPKLNEVDLRKDVARLSRKMPGKWHKEESPCAALAKRAKQLPERYEAAAMAQITSPIDDEYLTKFLRLFTLGETVVTPTYHMGHNLQMSGDGKNAWNSFCLGE